MGGRSARVVAVWLAVVLLVGGGRSPATAATRGVAPPAVAYRAPVAGPLVVVRGYDDVGHYEAGHRGVDLRVSAPGSVLAAGAGVVTFAGAVAGRGVVTVLHADGVRTSYEPVSPAVAAGRVVAAGDVIGTVTGTHGRFAPGTVLHWGARRGPTYLDPLSLLVPLGPVRLLPWDP